MFPNPPFAGFTWPLTQHMGVVSQLTLTQTLLAAAMYGDSRDPGADITNYLVVNNILTPNIRADNGQANTWRDYQQILSELGLIYSTEVERRITPTPLGLALLDKVLSFEEVMALQTLRYQYPNGHKLVVDEALRQMLAGTPLANVARLANLQQTTGVQIRPAVLVWRVLRLLAEEGEAAELTVDEIQSYLMRCTTHQDTYTCVASIVTARQGGASLAPMERGRRNTQDWIKLLCYTPLFSGATGRKAKVRISDYGVEHSGEIDSICVGLENPASFWVPDTLDVNDRRSWYAEFGSVNLDVPLISTPSAEVPSSNDNDDAKTLTSSNARRINLRDFDGALLGSVTNENDRTGRTITSTYDAGLANNKHRLHDLMVIYIASVCREKGASVYDDPDSVDLLVDHKGFEYIVEVKSVTPNNFLSRIRYALGQVIHYEYLRSLQSEAPRRKVIALAANVPATSWCVPFLNEYVDTDLLSLEGQVLKVRSSLASSRELFTPSSGNTTLGI